MNGRIYDAKLARFLQADTVIQFPYYTQGLNRYSYVLNNPLNATDPTGHILPIIVGIISVLAEFTLIEAAIAIGIASFTQTLIDGGSLGDAFLSGISAAALTYVGGSLIPGAETLGDYAVAGVALGTIGGITTTLQGGQFGHGFVSAGIGGLAGGALGDSLGAALGGEGFGAALGQIVGKAVVGGTISKVTGGKFANGARYAAFAAIASSIGQHIKAGGTINNPRIRIETEATLKADAIASMNLDVSSPEILAKAIENGAPEYVEQVFKYQGIGEINEITVTVRQNQGVLPASVGDVITLQQYMEGAIRNRESNHRLAFGALATGAGFIVSGPLTSSAAGLGRAALASQRVRSTCAVVAIVCASGTGNANLVKFVNKTIRPVTTQRGHNQTAQGVHNISRSIRQSKTHTR